MLCSLATHILVSWLAEKLFLKKIIPQKYDILRCFQDTKPGTVPMTDVAPIELDKELKKKDKSLQNKTKNSVAVTKKNDSLVNDKKPTSQIRGSNLSKELIDSQADTSNLNSSANKND